MIFKRPNAYFLCAGHADSEMPLNAFDHALLDAGIGDTNLVKMSSILPPAARKVEPRQLPYGSLIAVAYADMISSQPGELIASAVAIAIPEDDSLPGLIMEHHGTGSAEEIEKIVREMALRGFEHRKRTLKELVSISIEHRVEQHGATFAGVVLLDL